MSQPLTENEREVLRELVSQTADNPLGNGVGGMVGWARPQDLGGRDGSHHSRTLASLVRRGYVQKFRRSMLQHSRGSFLYAPTDAGKKAQQEDTP